MNRQIIGLILTLILLIGISGCSSIPDETDLKSWQDVIKKPIENTGGGSQTAQDDLLPKVAEEKIKVRLYFARKDGKGLDTEERSIKKVEGMARATIKELLKGPKDPQLKSVIPTGTKLLDVNLKPDGTCLVDFTSQIRNISGANAEALEVYSIVNTLSQFPTVDYVVFMVNGEPIDSLGGEFDLSDPVMADFDM
ncbi:MAG: GerMN domain-containing protein [Ignavibacteriales bacterium]